MYFLPYEFATQNKGRRISLRPFQNMNMLDPILIPILPFRPSFIFLLRSIHSNHSFFYRKMAKLHIFILTCLAVTTLGHQYFIKNMGRLFFFEDRQIFAYEIDLQPYYENVVEMEKTLTKLESLCSELRETKSQCEEYVTLYQRQMPFIKNNVNFMKNTKNRTKRSWFRFIPIAGKYCWHWLKQGIAITGISYLIENVSKDTEVVNATTMHEVLETQRLFIEHQNRTNLENKMFDAKNREYQEIATALTSMKFDHILDKDKYKDILSSSVRSQ